LQTFHFHANITTFLGWVNWVKVVQHSWHKFTPLAAILQKCSQVHMHGYGTRHDWRATNLALLKWIYNSCKQMRELLTHTPAYLHVHQGRLWDVHSRLLMPSSNVQPPRHTRNYWTFVSTSDIFYRAVAITSRKHVTKHFCVAKKYSAQWRDINFRKMIGTHMLAVWWRSHTIMALTC